MKFHFLIAALLCLPAVSSNAADTDERIVIAQAKSPIKTMTEPADGEVRRVDKAAGKVTLRHGELKGLDMPPMTMAFVIKDVALLGSLKEGDKVKFRAIDDNGKLTVIELKRVP